MLNLTFAIPESSGHYYETLPKAVQEILFRNYYALFKSGIKDGTVGKSIQIYMSLTELMEDALEEGDKSEICSFLESEETTETVERVNPFTGEKVLVRGRTTDKLSQEEAALLLMAEVKKRRDFLTLSEEILIEKFWIEEIEDFDESYLFESASNLIELNAVVEDYNRYVLVKEVTGRVRRKNLHDDYASEAIKCRDRFQEAEELERTGDPTFLQSLTTLSPEALDVKSQGRRICSEGGPCYICGKFVWPYNGELLLWNEIPKIVREKYIPDVFQKWHIRHFGPECSRPEFGTRDFFRHPSGPLEKKNSKPDRCIVCDVYVEANSGWLIPASFVPKWKQSRPAFPGANTKKYYVVCGKRD